MSAQMQSTDPISQPCQLVLCQSVLMPGARAESSHHAGRAACSRLHNVAEQHLGGYAQALNHEGPVRGLLLVDLDRPTLQRVTM